MFIRREVGGLETKHAGRSRNAVCYVVPYYATTDDQHFAHLPAFLTRLAKVCELYVIVERGSNLPQVPGARVMLQKVNAGNRVRRYVEFLSLVRLVRKAGCRRFFVRISKGAALALILTSPFLDTELYYWHSGDVGRAPRSDLPRARLRIEELITQFVVRRANRFVTGPESMVDYYVNRFGADPARCVVLYNDIDLSALEDPSPEATRQARQALSLDNQPVFALFTARLSFGKGGDLLPLIVDRLERLSSPLQMIVIGRPELDGIEEQLARRTMIHFVGSLPSGRVHAYRQASDIAILPSRSEGFPRTLIEAMASGLPVVLFDAGGVRDLLGPRQQRFVVPPGDLDTFAQLLHELTVTPKLRSELGAENLQQVQRFSSDRVVEMFVDRIVEPRI